jgi:ligand-binding sensor domain-containing protein
MKYAHICTFLLMVVFCSSCQRKGQKIIINSENRGVITSYGPKWITRNVIQDRKGNIWIAAFDGIFRYDGKSFINITSRVTSARFFSILEDRKGNFWLGSIGSGVYYYDGKSFQNYTTRDGLATNSVTCIYEDRTGNIWIGASLFDGKSFRNFTAKDGLTNNNVNSVIEDKTGKLWFATRGNTFVYDGKTFSVFTHDGKPFTNVRSIIEDKKGNIWLGGPEGLWRYDRRTFTNFTKKSAADIIEDKNGNIWTCSESAESPAWVASQTGNIQAWAISRYDGNSLSSQKPTVSEIKNKGMIFGFLITFDGSIWFGDFNGVHRYDGMTITDFKRKEGQK